MFLLQRLYGLKYKKRKVDTYGLDCNRGITKGRVLKVFIFLLFKAMIFSVCHRASQRATPSFQGATEE
jgi:hypothetical protein